MEPVELAKAEAKSKLKMMRWDMELNKYFSREDALQENSSASFSLTTKSISKITRSKLKSKAGCTDSEKNSNIVWLLENLEDLIYLS